METLKHTFSEQSDLDDFLPIVFRPIPAPHHEEDFKRKKFDGSETPDWFFSETSETDQTLVLEEELINWEEKFEKEDSETDDASDLGHHISTAAQSEDNQQEKQKEQIENADPVAFIASRLLSEDGAQAKVYKTSAKMNNNNYVYLDEREVALKVFNTWSTANHGGKPAKEYEILEKLKGLPHIIEAYNFYDKDGEITLPSGTVAKD